MRNLARRLFSLCLALAACGDDAKLNPPDASPPTTDAPVDSAAPFTPPTPFAMSLAAMGPDQLQSVTAAPDDKFYAAGFAAQTVTGPRLVTVVRYSAAGLDPAFGGTGIVTTTVEFKGGADEVDITTQPDGKILVSATVASPTNAADHDIAVIRMLPTGALDDTWGAAGIATLNLSDPVVNGTALVGLDAARSIAAGTGGIYVHAAARARGNGTDGMPRRDTDFTVIRLTDTGEIDPNFGDQGQARLDTGVVDATPRGLKILADGKLLASGYANSPGIGTTQPVIYKLTATGQLDTAFASNGLFHDTVLALQTEVYNLAIHGNKAVTGGYGREIGTTNDYISLRFDVDTGLRDLTWGGTTNGAVVFDPSGSKVGSNCRNAIALPGGKTLLIGSTGPGNMPAQDAVFAVLDATGKLDTTYGTGIHKFVLGSNGNDQFWGGAVSGNAVSVVGYKGGGTAQTEAMNDDAFAAVFTLQ